MPFRLVDANENYETRVLMIQFIKFKGLDKYKPIFESCAQFDDEYKNKNIILIRKNSQINFIFLI